MTHVIFHDEGEFGGMPRPVSQRELERLREEGIAMTVIPGQVEWEGVNFNRGLENMRGFRIQRGGPSPGMQREKPA